jgi:hypothetical protein
MEKYNKKEIKEFILVALDKENKPKMPIEEFIQMIGENSRGDIDQMIDSLKLLGTIYEPRPGFIQIL